LRQETCLLRNESNLGAGHSSSGESLCGRVLTALRSGGDLNEGVSAGYLDRHWPPALKAEGGWPLVSLRQSFLNGSLTRLLDPDATLRQKLVEFVEKGKMGIGSGQAADGGFERLWFREPISRDEITFDAGAFLVTKAKAEALRSKPIKPPEADPKAGVATAPEQSTATSLTPDPNATNSEFGSKTAGPPPAEKPGKTTITLSGQVPSEQWNRVGTKLLPKLRSAGEVQVDMSLSVTVPTDQAAGLTGEVGQVLADLGLTDSVKVRSGG